MTMDVRKCANDMRAKSVEKVMYKSEAKHVCYTGGTRCAVVSTHLQQADDGTYFGKCNKCGRFFYSTPGKHRAADNRIKKFAYA